MLIPQSSLPTFLTRWTGHIGHSDTRMYQVSQNSATSCWPPVTAIHSSAQLRRAV